jgi:polysaccharide biosynthesis transport protein
MSSTATNPEVTNAIPSPTPAPSRKFQRQNDSIDSIVLRLDSIRSSRNLASMVIGLSSTDRRSGVSEISRELAIRAADLSLGRVLLVDANLDAPSQGKYLRDSGQAGLAEIFSGEQRLADVIWSGKIPGFHFMTAGRPAQCKEVAITPDVTFQVIDELRQEYQFVILDLPTIASTTRFLVPASTTDGLVLVVDAQQTRSRKAMSALHLLKENKIDVMGCVLNRENRNLPSWLERWF